MKFLYKGIVTGGKAVFDDECRDPFHAKIQNLEGKRFEMTLDNEVKHRSKKQRGYYHGCLIELMMINEPFAGWTHDAVQVWIEANLGPKIYGENGKPDMIIPEEAWTTKQQEEVNERVRTLVLEKFNVLLPLPNEVLV